MMVRRITNFLKIPVRKCRCIKLRRSLAQKVVAKTESYHLQNNLVCRIRIPRISLLLILKDKKVEFIRIHWRKIYKQITVSWSKKCFKALNAIIWYEKNNIPNSSQQMQSLIKRPMKIVKITEMPRHMMTSKFFRNTTKISL